MDAAIAMPKGFCHHLPCLREKLLRSGPWSANPQSFHSLASLSPRGYTPIMTYFAYALFDHGLLSSPQTCPSLAELGPHRQVPAFSS